METGGRAHRVLGLLPRRGTGSLCPFVSLELNTTPAVHCEKGNCFPHVLSGKQGHSDFQFLVHKFNTG